MIDLSREANTLQNAIRVRADLRLRLDQLAELQANLDLFLQEILSDELGARSTAHSEAIKTPDLNGGSLDESSVLQHEADKSFRTLSSCIAAFTREIVALEHTISRLDHAIASLPESLGLPQRYHSADLSVVAHGMEDSARLRGDEATLTPASDLSRYTQLKVTAARCCEVKVDGQWQLVSLEHALQHHRAGKKRCPTCHGQVIAYGAYTSTARPNLTHRKAHSGCSSKPETYSGVPSRHPHALS